MKTWVDKSVADYKKNVNKQISFVQILPRDWWSDKAKELARHINCITCTMRKEHNLKVKSISLHKYSSVARMPDNIGQVY